MTAVDIDDIDEGYRGPATLLAGDHEIAVQVALSGRFEPFDGRYHWTGRLAPQAALTGLVRAGIRAVRLRVPDGEPAVGKLGEPDPWGGVRITGAGRPPWTPDPG